MVVPSCLPIATTGVGRELFGAMRPRRRAGVTLLRRLRHLCVDEAQVPEVVPHSLRGLHATLASGFGATSHAVAAALGHTSFALTARHYVNRYSP
jgi:integrase